MRVLAGLAALLAACGGNAPDLQSPGRERRPGDETSSDPAPIAPERQLEETSTVGPLRVPSACAPETTECLPPASWVEKLCEEVYAEVALFLFRADTPWQRRYLRGKTRAVNASGGASVEGDLVRDEEVLVLRHRRADPNGMQIGDGSGQYDALRWNGSCVSLEGGELTERRPTRPKTSRIEWRWLGDAMRSELRRDESVTQTYRARRKECRGATTGVVSKKCERLDRELIEVIARFVRSEPELPEPELRP